MNIQQYIRDYELAKGGSLKQEMGEQGDPASGGADTQKANVTTWSQIVGSKVSRGKANPLMKNDEKWVSGVSRTGPANQLF